MTSTPVPKALLYVGGFFAAYGIVALAHDARLGMDGLILIVIALTIAAIIYKIVRRRNALRKH